MKLKKIYLDNVDSTNLYGKNLNYHKDTITAIVSNKQSSGKGRRGKDFVSDEGGLYLTLVVDDDIPNDKIPFLTHLTAVVVYIALKSLNINTLIKWPNDIILNDKKLCGILCEYISINNSNRVLCGIGLNIRNDVEKIDNATSLLKEGFFVEKELLLEKIIDNFTTYYKEYKKDIKTDILEIIRENSYVLGKQILVHYRDEILSGIAKQITDDGYLVVEYQDGTKKELNSGEVSIRKHLN